MIFKSKVFVENATIVRERGLRPFHIKHNLFHQGKLWRDVEVQNKQIVLFKSPRDVMHVSTLSAKMGLQLELDDCCRDGTSVSYGHFLMDLSP